MEAGLVAQLQQVEHLHAVVGRLRHDVRRVVDDLDVAPRDRLGPAGDEGGVSEGSLRGHSRGHSGVTQGSLRGHSGVTQGSVRGHLGPLGGHSNGHFGVSEMATLGSLSGRVTWGQSRGQSEGSYGGLVRGHR